MPSVLVCETVKEKRTAKAEILEAFDYSERLSKASRISSESAESR